MKPRSSSLSLISQLHTFTEKWRSCKLCPLHQHAKHHVVIRGAIPAQVLLIGEAPGKVENTLGKPFVGPAGQLLNNTLARLSIESYCITNIVCCIPWLGNDPQLNEIRQPTDGEAGACAPHVRELVALAKPRLVVCLGEVAKRHLGLALSSQENLPTAFVRHPAYVLRRGGIDSAEHKKLILSLQRACQEHGVDHVPAFTEQSYVTKVQTNG